MKDWKKVCIGPDRTVLEALKTIDAGAIQIALVTDESCRLLGSVTDGDIRRAVLKGTSLDAPVSSVMNPSPVKASTRDSDESVISRMKARWIYQIPVVDEQNRLVGLKILEELIQSELRDNWVVLMAGGLGSRMKPLTDTCPKPLLKIGNKPILETIVEDFVNHGFRRIFIAVNYMADSIKDYFGDGSRWNASISYLDEKERLGTAGALRLLPDIPNQPVIVMNADVLTQVNFGQLLDFHARESATATMCVREYDMQVPYGVISTEGSSIVSIDEKPVHRFFVNAGIYVLSPKALSCLDGGYTDMTTLFDQLRNKQDRCIVFPIHEYWLDIGKMSDYERANQLFPSDL
ncbi:nucleotidyltransferase family protein [Kamptonema cortianum]|nr:nucleotidyltransferase family protein [Oscillatoria laete-virens]MDK3155390.1 nucleotidyltransferase family protein [Kamptonema cortianum]MDL5046139.1 nucleotidyltransferase family protein [Oscillatoria amoena NRMC-F 0135]MDL5052838.1 nucleotidyltransferase family protein [Oscillatoria laete-virens NRMC-F 0139]